jgi:hypothetical protein
MAGILGGFGGGGGILGSFGSGLRDTSDALAMMGLQLMSASPHNIGGAMAAGYGAGSRTDLARLEKRREQEEKIKQQQAMVAALKAGGYDDATAAQMAGSPEAVRFLQQQKRQGIEDQRYAAEQAQQNERFQQTMGLNREKFAYEQAQSAGPQMKTVDPTHDVYVGGKLVRQGQPKDKEPTQDQSAAAGYANRMAEADKVITENEGINKGMGGGIASDLSRIPHLGNHLSSAPRQMVEQAQRNFINSVLRKESGAVISDSEFENARKQYFPQPGDSDAVIEQKRKNRQTTIQGVAGAAGRNYTPPQGSGGKPGGGGGRIRAYDPQTGTLKDWSNE